MTAIEFAVIFPIPKLDTMQITTEYITKLLKNGIDAVGERHKVSYAEIEVYKDESEDITSHYNGSKPKKLFGERFPSEREVYRKYREENFQPITRASVLRGLAALYRIFTGANHSIHYNAPLDEYMEKAKFEGLTFPQYIFKTFITNSVCDPNGWLVTVPKKPENSNDRAEIELICVPSSALIITPKSHAGIFAFQHKNAEKIMQYKGETYQVKSSYYIITKEWYYKYVQVSRKGKEKRLLIPYYKNYCGEITAVKNGGITAMKKNELEQISYQISYFAHAVPYLNEARIDHTLHQVNKVLNGSPKLVIGGTECSNCHGQPVIGQEWCDKEQCNKQIFCDKCGGFGFTKPESQFDAIEVLPPVNEALGQSYKFVYDYITVPIANLEHLGKEAEKNIQKADEVLLLRFVQEAQSGVAKEIDREEKYSSFYSISDYIFDTVMQRLLTWIDCLRHRGRAVGFQIHKPISFQIKTEIMLWEELCEKLTKNAPQGDIIATYLDYITKRYPTNKKMQKIEKICIYYEPHYIHTITQRQQLQASENIDKNANIRATRVNGIVRLICEDLGDQQFLDASFSQIKKRIDELMKEYMPSEQVNGELTTEQKRLRSLVGTMRSITELQKAVVEGSIEKDEAINSVVTLLGFTPEEAANLIGDAVPSPEPAQ